MVYTSKKISRLTTFQIHMSKSGLLGRQMTVRWLYFLWLYFFSIQYPDETKVCNTQIVMLLKQPSFNFSSDRIREPYWMVLILNNSLNLTSRIVTSIDKNAKYSHAYDDDIIDDTTARLWVVPSISMVTVVMLEVHVKMTSLFSNWIIIVSTIITTF